MLKIVFPCHSVCVWARIGSLKMKKEISIKRYKNGTISEEKDVVAAEKNIDLILNKKAKLMVSMSPGDLKAFTYGFLRGNRFNIYT